MDPSTLTFAPLLAAAGFAVALVVLGVAAVRVTWARFAQNEATHVALGSVLFVVLLWSIRTTLPGAPPMHLLAAGALCLSLGPALALVCGALAVAITMALQAAPFANAGLVFVVQVAVPVAVQYAALVAAQRALPRNPFAYFFAVAFAGAGASFFAAAMSGHVLALAAVQGAASVITHAEYSILALLLSFAEAT